MENTFYILYGVLCVGIGAWLAVGIAAYGMTYAYMQRHYTNGEAAKDLYRDMRTALLCIPQGPFGIIKVSSYLIDHGGWDEEEGYPLHGFKFLPRHEYRY